MQLLSFAQPFVTIDSSIIIMNPSSKLYFFHYGKPFMNYHIQHILFPFLTYNVQDTHNKYIYVLLLQRKLPFNHIM